MARRIIRRKVIRPNLKDYLRTGIVQVVNIYEYETGTGELFDEETDELDAINASASASAKTGTGRKRRSRKSTARFESVPQETVINEAEGAAASTSVIENAASADEAQAFLDLLASDDRPMWDMILAVVTDVTCEDLDFETLRDEFEAMTPEEHDRFTYYLLPEKGAGLVPVQRAEQLSEPACCVLRWDENGVARFSLEAQD